MGTMLGDYGESATSSEKDTIRELVPWIRHSLEQGRSLPPVAQVPLSVYAGDLRRHAGPDFLRRMEHANMGGLASVWFPGTDPRLREAVETFMVWTFFADDGIAEAGLDYSRYIQPCDTALRENVLADPDDPVFLCLRKFREKLEELGAAHLIPELADAILACNKSWRLEQKWRDGPYPPLSEYLRERGNVVTTYVMTVLLRIHYGIFDRVPPAVVQHAQQVTLITGLENDLLSAYRESHEGTPLTFLRVIQNECGLALEPAVKCAVALTNALRQSCDQLGARMLTDPSLSTPVIRYIHAMNQWADACYAWHLGAKRYRLSNMPL